MWHQLYTVLNSAKYGYILTSSFDFWFTQGGVHFFKSLSFLRLALENLRTVPRRPNKLNLIADLSAFSFFVIFSFRSPPHNFSFIFKICAAPPWGFYSEITELKL